MTYCTDTDLLRWDPTLLADAAFASQTRLTGTGTLAGTTFTLAAGSFTDAGVVPGEVLVLGGPSVAGCYPIVAVASDTTLVVSSLHEQLDDGVARPVGAADAAAFTVRTLWPQRDLVCRAIDDALELRPGQVVTNPSALRRAAALGTLHLVYTALSAINPEQSLDRRIRAELFERLYRKALRGAVVEIDTDGDGEPDVARSLAVIRLQHA